MKSNFLSNKNFLFLLCYLLEFYLILKEREWVRFQNVEQNNKNSREREKNNNEEDDTWQKKREREWEQYL